MLATPLTVGHIEVLALLDGMGDLKGPMADSFPDVPREALESFRDRAPGVYGRAGAWRLHVRAWLVRHPGGVVLVDTGLGARGAPGPEWFGAPGQLLDSLRETGTPPDAIDTVVLSHVHDDHLGGTVIFPDGDDIAPVPAFPRATYLLQRADREWQSEQARADEEDRVIDMLLLRPIERAGQLDVARRRPRDRGRDRGAPGTRTHARAPDRAAPVPRRTSDHHRRHVQPPDPDPPPRLAFRNRCDPGAGGRDAARRARRASLPPRYHDLPYAFRPGVRARRRGERRPGDLAADLTLDPRYSSRNRFLCRTGNLGPKFRFRATKMDDEVGEPR